MDLNNVKEKITLARKAVEGEEEPYKTEAFKIIFSKLLEGIDTPQSGKGDTSKHVQQEKERLPMITESEKAVLVKIDVNKLQYLKSLKSVHDQSLALLAYVSKNTREYPGLTSDEMKEILSEKFGLTTITVNNISMSLKNVTGKYVTRKEISFKTQTSKIKKYRYVILQKGMEYIQKKIAETQKPVK